MPHHPHGMFTGVVILTHTKEELKEALEALAEVGQTEPHPPPRPQRLRLAELRERVA